MIIKVKIFTVLKLILLIYVKKLAWFSNNPILFHFQFYENVVYGLRLKGVKDKALLDEVVENSLKAANIWDEVKDILHSSALGL